MRTPATTFRTESKLVARRITVNTLIPVSSSWLLEPDKRRVRGGAPTRARPAISTDGFEWRGKVRK